MVDANRPCENIGAFLARITSVLIKNRKFLGPNPGKWPTCENKLPENSILFQFHLKKGNFYRTKTQLCFHWALNTARKIQISAVFL